jgi:hypothetical protein
VERPHVWICGPDDPVKHSAYLPWLRSRAQANFRNEEWTLTFDEFWDLWKDKWLERGRKPEQYCMTRIDSEKAWDIENSIIITRHEHLIRQGSSRTGKTKDLSSEPKKRGRKPGGKNNPNLPKKARKPSAVSMFRSVYGRK